MCRVMVSSQTYPKIISLLYLCNVQIDRKSLRSVDFPCYSNILVLFGSIFRNITILKRVFVKISQNILIIFTHVSNHDVFRDMPKNYSNRITNFPDINQKSHPSGKSISFEDPRIISSDFRNYLKYQDF